MHLYGFTCEMDFSHYDSQNPVRIAFDEGGILRRAVRNPSHMENHAQCIYRIIYTLTHFIQARYTVQSCRS